MNLWYSCRIRTSREPWSMRNELFKMCGMSCAATAASSYGDGTRRIVFSLTWRILHICTPTSSRGSMRKVGRLLTSPVFALMQFYVCDQMRC